MTTPRILPAATVVALSLVAAATLVFAATDDAASQAGGQTPGQSAAGQSSVVWNAQVTSGSRGDYTGYQEGSYGSITDDTFVFGGHTYRVWDLRYRTDDQELMLDMDDCLKKSELVHLKIGSATFRDPDEQRRTDATCASNRSKYQRFTWRDVTTNPLPSGSTKSVELSVSTSGSGGNPTPTPDANTWRATIGSAKDNGDDEYGYEYQDFGTITDRTFTFKGRTYYIDYIKWEDAFDDVQFRLLDCIGPSELVHLKLGSRTFTSASHRRYTDSECGANRSRNQLLKFSGVSINPLSAGSNVSVELKFNPTPATATPTRTSTATPSTNSPTPTRTPTPSKATNTPTPTPTAVSGCGVTSLGNLVSTLTRSGVWTTSSCESENRFTGRYAKYYSFSISQPRRVTINLSSSVDTYVYLLSGSNSTGSVVAEMMTFRRVTGIRASFRNYLRGHIRWRRRRLRAGRRGVSC